MSLKYQIGFKIENLDVLDTTCSISICIPILLCIKNNIHLSIKPQYLIKIVLANRKTQKQFEIGKQLS